MSFNSTEEKILKAAISVFTTKGRDGARVHEIAKAAGVNKALIFYHFRSKEKLFTLVIEKMIKSFIASLSKVSDNNDDFKSFLSTFIDSFIVIIERNIKSVNFIFWELKRNPGLIDIIKNKSADILNLNFYEFLRLRLENAYKSGEIRQVDPVQFFLNLFSLCGYNFFIFDIFKKGFNITGTQTREILFKKRKNEIFRLLWNDIKK
jgi:TetR/AcrR family transcriptional regulator